MWSVLVNLVLWTVQKKSPAHNKSEDIASRVVRSFPRASELVWYFSPCFFPGRDLTPNSEMQGFERKYLLSAREHVVFH